MNNKDFLPVIRLLKDVGAKIKSWKFNPSYKKIHSKNNFKTEPILPFYYFVESFRTLYIIRIKFRGNSRKIPSSIKTSNKVLEGKRAYT